MTRRGLTELFDHYNEGEQDDLEIGDVVDKLHKSVYSRKSNWHKFANQALERGEGGRSSDYKFICQLLYAIKLI